jgi:hypothetical protein
MGWMLKPFVGWVAAALLAVAAGGALWIQSGRVENARERLKLEQAKVEQLKADLATAIDIAEANARAARRVDEIAKTSAAMTAAAAAEREAVQKRTDRLKQEVLRELDKDRPTGPVLQRLFDGLRVDAAAGAAGDHESRGADGRADDFSRSAPPPADAAGPRLQGADRDRSR